MSEKEITFLNKLRAMFADAPFLPREAMEPFRLSELPELVRDDLVEFGPGSRVTRTMARWLGRVGAVRTSTRTNAGYLWMLP
jgi:hypothetical protein